jgi:hypothetical protein
MPFRLHITLSLITFGRKSEIMSKNKRKQRTPEGEWESFVTKMLNRKRENRSPSLPMDYLNATADSLHRLNPSKEIVLNTLVDVANVLGEKFYIKGTEDIKAFRDKKEKRRVAEWNKIKDDIDDQIHIKNLK